MGFFEAIEHWGYLISNSQCLYLYLQMLFNFQSFLCQCIHGCLCTNVSQLSHLSFHHGSQGLNSDNHTVQQVLLSVGYLAAIAQVSVCVCVSVCVIFIYVCTIYWAYLCPLNSIILPFLTSFYLRIVLLCSCHRDIHIFIHLHKM